MRLPNAAVQQTTECPLRVAKGKLYKHLHSNQNNQGYTKAKWLLYKCDHVINRCQQDKVELDHLHSDDDAPCKELLQQA